MVLGGRNAHEESEPLGYRRTADEVAARLGRKPSVPIGGVANAKAIKLTRMRPTIRAFSRYPSSHQLRFEKSSREKGLQRSSTYVVGRLRNAYSSQPFASTARALNVAITAN